MIVKLILAFRITNLYSKHQQSETEFIQLKAVLLFMIFYLCWSVYKYVLKIYRNNNEFYGDVCTRTHLPTSSTNTL
jgi:uncharacterized protein with PQ loop repeat